MTLSLLVGALAMVATAQTPLPDWSRADTPHFVVYGAAAPAAEVAEDLEAYDALLVAAQPDLVNERRRAVPVLLLDDHDMVVRYLRPRERRLAGGDLLFRTSGTRPMIAVDGSRWADGSHDVRRRYAEALFDGQPPPRPWLRIGLAELYAGARIGEGGAVLGEPNAAHYRVLTGTRSWIPFDAVLSADKDSPLLRKPEKRALFAAQAWLLVHWLQLDPVGTRQAQLAELLTPGQRARVVERASLEALSPGGRQLEEVLRDWLAQPAWPTTRVEVPVGAPLAVVVVPPVEVGYRLGTLLALQRRLDEADTLFRDAMDLAPESWMPHDGLGQVYAARQRWILARESFDEAVTRAPTDPAPHLDYGMATFHGFGQRGRRPAARLAFQQALALDPTLVDAYAGMAMLAGAKRDWGEAAKWAGRGLQHDPGDGRLRALLGRAQLAAGDYDHAILNAQIALQQCEDDDTCAMARTLYQATVSRH